MTADGLSEVPGKLWKLTLRPGGAERSKELAFDFCQDRGIIGVGWGLPQEPDDEAEVKQLCRERWGEFPGPVNAVVNRMDEGDHAWVYGNGRFWVCRIDGQWQHEAGADPWDRCDIHHFRDATWKAVPAPLVPGVVKRNLFQRGTAHQMRKGVVESTRLLSGWLFEANNLEKVLDRPVPFEEVGRALERIDPHDVFQLLGPDEVEDVAGLFVQNEGWRMLKSSAYRQKKKWECEFTRRSSEGPQTAYMQVKSGNRSLSAAPYLLHLQSEEWLYLVSTARRPYLDRDQVEEDRVIFVEPMDLLRFLADFLPELPPAISLKLGLATGVVA